jgi:hypothetical protein
MQDVRQSLTASSTISSRFSSMLGTKDKAGIFRSTTLAGSAPLPPSWLDSQPHLMSKPNPADDGSLIRNSEITKRRRVGDSELARKKARHSFTTSASLPPNNSVEIPIHLLSDAFPSGSISTTSNHAVADSHSNTLGCVETNAEVGSRVNLMCPMAGRAGGAPCSKSTSQQPSLLRSSRNDITFQPNDDVQALQQQLASAQAELREFRTLGDNICQSCKEKFSPSTEHAPSSVLVNLCPSPSKPTNPKRFSQRILRQPIPTKYPDSSLTHPSFQSSNSSSDSSLKSSALKHVLLPQTSNPFSTVSTPTVTAIPSEIRPEWSVHYKTTERRAIDVNFVRAFAQEAYVACVKFSQDGKYLAAAIGELTGKAVIWEVDSSKEIRLVSFFGFSLDVLINLRN